MPWGSKESRLRVGLVVVVQAFQVSNTPHLTSAPYQSELSYFFSKVSCKKHQSDQFLLLNYSTKQLCKNITLIEKEMSRKVHRSYCLFLENGVS